MSKSIISWQGLAFTALLGIFTIFAWVFYYIRIPQSTPIMRGYLVAQKMGCFGCHGPDGQGGVPNPGSSSGEIPPFAHAGALTSYIRGDAEMKEWDRRALQSGQFQRLYPALGQ